MTPETALFLLNLLESQTLSVGAPDFDDAVAAIQRARAELHGVLRESAPS